MILYYGHSGVSKGVDYLIEAIPEILEQNPNSILIFNLIPAKRDSEIKKRIRSKGAGQRVQIFSGYPKDELRELIATVDLIIAPSLAEGFGSVHSETCAMGKTLLTTQVASIPEVVSGEAKLIQPGSSTEIIQGIKEIRTKKLSPLPKKNFDRDQSVERIEKLYHT